jgi:hypothetical protein
MLSIGFLRCQRRSRTLALLLGIREGYIIPVLEIKLSRLSLINSPRTWIASCMPGHKRLSVEG